MARFERDGVGFMYPENWQVADEETESGWTVSVQSPDTTFFLLSFDGNLPEPAAMADTALEALRSEYPALDADRAVDSLAGRPAVGHDVQFFSFDLTNTCWLRSIHGAGGTLLVMWEANDLELERLGPVLKAMAKSLTVAGE